jgi:hypothetical protein
MWVWASQYEQSPAPRGGGIFARDAWQVWAPPDNKFPVFDGAFSARQEADFSALTVWGVFTHPKERERRICLITAWQKRLEISGDHQLLEWLPSERNTPLVSQTDQNGQSRLVSHGRQLWAQRTQRHWGLIQWVHETCRRYGVDKLLIEDARAASLWPRCYGIGIVMSCRTRFSWFGLWAIRWRGRCRCSYIPSQKDCGPPYVLPKKKPKPLRGKSI